MEQIGLVKTCKGKRALVKIVRESACGDNCASCNLCGEKERKQWVVNDMGAKEGDTVKIELSASSALLMSFTAYVLPILTAAAACMIFTRYIENKAAVDALSFITLVLAVFITARSDKIFFKSSRFKSKITEIF
jgi:sigma-E factor negative regulatory protein RseC